MSKVYIKISVLNQDVYKPQSRIFLGSRAQLG